MYLGTCNPSRNLNNTNNTNVNFGNRACHIELKKRSYGGGATLLCDLNGDVRPDSVWFSGCFVLNGVSISSLSVLNRVSLHELMA